MIKLIDSLLNKIFAGRVHKDVHQFIRYLIAGGTATVADMIALFVLTHFFQINHLIAAAIGFAIGVITNYSLNIALVFKSTGKLKKEFSLFLIIGLGGLLWTELILWILVDNLGLYIMLAKVFAVGLVLFWNFFMRKKFVFSTEPILQKNLS